MHDQLRPKLVPTAEVRHRSDGTDGLYDPETGHHFETAADQKNLVQLFDGTRTLLEISAEFMNRHGYVPFAALDDLMWGLADAGMLVNPPAVERPGVLTRNSMVESIAPHAGARWKTAWPAALRALELVLFPALGVWLTVTQPERPLDPIDVPLFYVGAVLAMTLRERFKAAVCALSGFSPRRAQVESMLGLVWPGPDNAVMVLLDAPRRVLGHLAALAGAATAVAIGHPFPGLWAGALLVLLFDLCPMVHSSASGILQTVSGQMNLREHVRAYVGLPLIKNLLSFRLKRTERALMVGALLSMGWLVGLAAMILGLISTGVELIDLGLRATGIWMAVAYAGAAVIFVVCPLPLLVAASQVIESAFSLLWPPDAGGKRAGGAADLAVFRSIPLFSTLSDQDLGAIAGHSREVTYEPGHVIVAEGSAGNVFYSVRSGAVEVAQGEGTMQRVVAQLGVGDCFGETAMLKDGVRSATVRALSQTVVIELATEAFDKVVATVGGVEFAAVLKAANTIGKSKLFRELPAERLSSLAAQFVPRTVAAGTDVVKFGEQGSEFYLVAKGQVEVLSGEGKKLVQLGDGDHFGEIALLRSVPRTATVRALTDTLLLVLSREVFLEALNADLSLSAKVEKIVAARAAVS